jgi:hypothetical protein
MTAINVFNRGSYYTLLVQICLSHVRAVLGSPYRTTTPRLDSLSDAWAQVVANVAPLMALVGEGIHVQCLVVASIPTSGNSAS